MSGGLFATAVSATLTLGSVPLASPASASLPSAVLPPPGVPPAAPPDASPDSAMTLATGLDRIARMTVSVFVNDRGPFQFVVDTGATRTILSSALAARLALPAGKTAQVHDIAGINGVATAMVDRIRVGSRQVDNITAPLLSASDMGADGILGIDSLVDQQVVMDFSAETMTISPPRRAVSEPDTIVVKARRRFGQLILADARVEGRRIYVIVDSGAEYSIGNSVLREWLLGRKRRPVAERIVLIGVTGRTLTADYIVAPMLKIGNITFKGVPIAFSDAHPFRQFGLEKEPAMLLGMDLLRSFGRVSLDFEQKRVRFTMKEPD